MDTPLQLFCFHIMANLPEDYDRKRLPGYVDTTDGAGMSCALEFKTIKGKKRNLNKKVREETECQKSKLTLDYYFKRKETISESESSDDDVQVVSKTKDEIDSMVKSPWKLAVLHTGTLNVHWHFIYISSHAHFKTSSRLGEDIFNCKNKIQNVKCLRCLRNYLYSGNGRLVIVDNTSNDTKDVVLCEEHLKQAEDGIIHNNESEFEDDNLLRSVISNTSKSIYFSNHELMDMFLENRAFTDSSARLVLSKTNQGRNFLFKTKVNDTIKTAISTCKLLVFQETAKERLDRAKKYYIQCHGNRCYENDLKKLHAWVLNNNIGVNHFANVTYKHFHKMTGKKNNLFFYGPPSTGKSMIMESLVACHYNFTRLTGLVDNSPFNFSSLIHANACFMDEIKLTESHFEQWKLIAGGLPCSTDVKYHEKSDIVNCTMYTSSNYEIGAYCKVQDCSSAIQERTFTFNIYSVCKEFFQPSPHVWEMFWEKYATII